MTRFNNFPYGNRLCALVLMLFLLFASTAIAQDTVVVIPLFGDQTAGLACNGTLSSGGRWCDHGDGTVTDMTTGLIWLKKTDWGGLRPWPPYKWPCDQPYESARERAVQLYAGAPGAELTDGSQKGDWRLPTKHEFTKITRSDGVEPIRASTPYFFTGLKTYFYWSNSPYPSEQAWYMHTENGYVLFGAAEEEYYVWPVRCGHY